MSSEPLAYGTLLLCYRCQTGSILESLRPFLIFCGMAKLSWSNAQFASYPSPRAALPWLTQSRKRALWSCAGYPFVGDPAYVSKWVYFARFWIGFHLSRQTKAWSFLRSNSTPKYIGRHPPMYFRHVLTALDRLSLDLTLLPDYKVRTFYAKLAHNPPAQLQCALAWEGRLNSPLPWPTTWSTMYGGLSTNWEADIAWRIAHGVLKTRAYLKRWRRLAVSDRCAICGQVETFSHVFCECTHSPAVWTWIVAVLNKLYVKPLVFSPALVLFKQGLPSGARASRSNELTRVLINITLIKCTLGGEKPSYFREHPHRCSDNYSADQVQD